MKSLQDNLLRLLFAVLFWVSMCDGALAQAAPEISPTPQFAIGFATPVTGNHHVEVTSGRAGVAPAVWVEAAFPRTAGVSLHLAVDSPASFEVLRRHDGSGGFVSTSAHRDLSIVPLVALHRRSVRRVRPVGLLGFGVLLSRTSTVYRSTRFNDGVEITAAPDVENKLLPAIIGGLDVEVRLSDRVNLIARMRGTTTWRREYPSNDIIGAFTLSPGVGVQFRGR